MGVPGLWSQLAPHPAPTSFSCLAAPLFTSPQYGLRLGIDMSIWLIELDHASRTNHYMLEPVIERIFDRICTLLRSGVLPFFIFDGPGRPSVKRNHRSSYGGGQLTSLEARVLPLLDLLGVPWRRAPGEAEAELAAVLRRGELDAILTDDSDALAFGAHTIIRYTSHLGATPSKASTTRTPPSSNPTTTSKPTLPSKTISKSAAPRSISVFRTAELNGGLTPAAFILVGVLCGGDYGAGVRGLGILTALALAKAGFGDALLSAEGDIRALSEWRSSVAKQLANNTNQLLSRKEPTLARRILELQDFPSPAILASYTSPLISSHLPPPSWSTPLDAKGVSQYAMDTFGWRDPARAKRLAKALWPALFVVELRRAAMEVGLQIPSPPLPLSPLSHSYCISSLFDISSPLKTNFTTTDGVAAFGVQFHSAIFCTHSNLPPSSITSPTASSDYNVGLPVVWMSRAFLVAERNANQVVLQWEEGGRRQEVSKERTAAARRARLANERVRVERERARADSDSDRASAEMMTPSASSRFGERKVSPFGKSLFIFSLCRLFGTSQTEHSHGTPASG
ncbi:holliday junction resolvase GEN1/YEN1, partial [Phenoliferia sp. Uapishka_3]